MLESLGKKNKVTHLEYMNISLMFQNHYSFMFEARKNYARTRFFFFYLWGRPELRLSHFSLRGRLYSNPCFSSPVHLQRRSTPDGVINLYWRKEVLWARNGRSNLARQSDFHVIAWFFNMPQSCDMGQTALLPLRRKACRGFCFRPKIPTASAGFEPAIRGTRGQHADH
jgi:hypothetical protein